MATTLWNKLTPEAADWHQERMNMVIKAHDFSRCLALTRGSELVATIANEPYQMTEDDFSQMQERILYSVRVVTKHVEWPRLTRHFIWLSLIAGFVFLLLLFLGSVDDIGRYNLFFLFPVLYLILAYAKIMQDNVSAMRMFFLSPEKVTAIFEKEMSNSLIIPKREEEYKAKTEEELKAWVKTHRCYRDACLGKGCYE